MKPDERLKDWWVENPWQIAAKGKSLSGYERNRIYLNSLGSPKPPGEGGRSDEFFEISGLTSADSDGDARAVVASDFNSDGMEDIIVRQAGGGSFLLFENRFPKAHWLRVTLRGKKSNTLGLGARLVAEVAGQKIVRELYPYNGYKAQGPAHVHFGLGKATAIDRLTITWPSGATQELRNLTPNRHLRIVEGDPQFATTDP